MSPQQRDQRFRNLDPAGTRWRRVRELMRRQVPFTSPAKLLKEFIGQFQGTPYEGKAFRLVNDYLREVEDAQAPTNPSFPQNKWGRDALLKESQTPVSRRRGSRMTWE